MTTELRFHMDMSREQALRYYQGTASAVIVMSDDGQKIQFPAQHIRPFIDQDGIHGHFSIRFDANNKLIGLQRV